MLVIHIDISVVFIFFSVSIVNTITCILTVFFLSDTNTESKIVEQNT